MDDPTPLPPRQRIEELDALLEDPERWSEVDPDKLRHLLFYQCLSYGLRPDEDRIPTLMALHHVAVERLHAAVRQQVVVHLARGVERVHREHRLQEGAGCTNALLPFLLEDPDPSVVASAATEMALLLPAEQGDPLTGPRYVRSLLEQAGGDEARAGIIAGLLQLGDARVAPLVTGAWKGLGQEGRETLALLVQGFRGVHTLAVGFLLEWLEDEVGQPGSGTFGIVAATLARAGRYAGEHHVAEVRRTFPLTDAPESQPLEILREIRREAFTPSIEQRLLHAARQEDPPQLMPHVLNYWGLEAEAYRLSARGAARTASVSLDASTGVCEPVGLELAPDWPEAPEEETLLEWGIFNPLGPTINTLRATPVDEGTALVSTQYHPAETVSRVLALVPARAAEPAQEPAPPPGDAGPAPRAGRTWSSIVRLVMARNGRDGVWLLRSLPDYVHIPQGSPLERSDVAEAIAAARRAALRHGDEAADLAVHAARLRRLASDPWETTRREVDEAVGASSPDASVHAADVIPPADVEGDSGRVPGDWSAAAYLRWLEVAAAPSHVAAIRSQLPLAWQRLDEAPGGDGPV